MKISLITATHAAASTTTLEGPLAGLQALAHAEREHTVIDGASRAGTHPVRLRQHARIGCPSSGLDRGMCEAPNQGLARARSEAVCSLHAEKPHADKDALARIAGGFADTLVDAADGDFNSVLCEALERVVRHGRAGQFSSARRAWCWLPSHPPRYVRRKLYQRLGGLDSRYRIAADYGRMLRVPRGRRRNVLRDRRVLRGISGAGAPAWKHLGDVAALADGETSSAGSLGVRRPGSWN